MAPKKIVFTNNPLFQGPAYEQRKAPNLSPYKEIPIDLIDRDINQPRVYFDPEGLEELACSIKQYGILSPLLVRRSIKAGRFVLIAGERRLRAAKMAGLKTVPALVDTCRGDDPESNLVFQLTENLQRRDLTPLERAHAIGALKDSTNLSVRELAEKLGISKSSVQRSLDLLELPDDLINALREGVAESKILALAKVEDKELRAKLLKAAETVSREELIRLINRAKRGGFQKGKRKIQSVLKMRSEDRRIADEIQKELGLRTSIKRSAEDEEKGRVIIEFYSEADLKEVFRRLVS
ncbi:MAG: ParB/RepB/Spo0J family partition protein [Candidatus Dadabacteria bacterium]|nr:MAG: ParB/RepB/Spo0J family partition protein [Candidatus Dadabacteria bacterium]